MLYKTAFFCYNMSQFEGVVKMEKIPYDYIFFLMFHCLRKFGDRNYVELDVVPDFLMQVLELAKENAKEELSEEIEFEEINVEE